MKQLRISATARTEGFDGERTDPALAKMGEKQSREDGFANAGVSAGDERNSRSLGASHAQELTTDVHG